MNMTRITPRRRPGNRARLAKKFCASFLITCATVLWTTPADAVFRTTGTCFCQKPDCSPALRLNPPSTHCPRSYLKAGDRSCDTLLKSRGKHRKRRQSPTTPTSRSSLRKQKKCIDTPGLVYHARLVAPMSDL